MAHDLTTPTARIDAILFSGRGADGALGAEAQALSFPASRFVRCPAPQRDLAEPAEVAHRSVWRAWVAFDTEPSPINSRDEKILANYTLAIEVSYVAASGASGWVRAAGSEDKAAAAADPSIAALSDAARIRAALSLPALYQDSGDNPAIVDVQAIGDASTSYEDRLLVVRQNFRVRLWGVRTNNP